MKTKYFISFIIISFVIIGSVILTDKVFAQEPAGAPNIQYPVQELGNCQDQTACKTYCDKPENTEACVSFAENNNMMSKKEIDMAKKFVASGSKGPGGCAGKDACETYCNDISHIDACVSFAEKNNLMPPKELEEAKKVQAAIKRGVKPPACGDKKACDVYCDSPDHMEECITFGIEAGFIQGKELEDVQKMLAAVKRGVKPPPCHGKDACDQYCGDPNNMEVCITFAMEAGFMSEKEKAESQKMLAAVKKGIKPPACRGKEECDVYCSQDAHFEECFQFAEAAGFMSAEEAAMARKTGGKGPGGCKGKNECEAFCNNPDNQETCFNFGKEHGMIPEKDLKMMEEGKQRFQETMTQMPPEVADCLKSLVGEEMFEKFKSGAVMPPREIGDQMRTCFEKGMGQPAGEQFAPGTEMPPGQIMEGPGGCKGPEECKAYCESHPEECQKFQPGPGVINPGGQMMPQQAGPGGCKTPDECKAYCESHPEECKDFQPMMPPGGPEKPVIMMPPKEQFESGPKPGGCTTPEECQAYCQSHPEECQQTQNRIMTPDRCEGENCQFGPPPSGQQPQQGMTPTVNQQPIDNNIAPPPTQTPPPLSPEQISPNILQIFLNFLRGK